MLCWITILGGVLIMMGQHSRNQTSGSELVIQPLASHLWQGSEQVSSLLETPALDWKLAPAQFGYRLDFCRFGEEIGYRGYLLTRAADLARQPLEARLCCRDAVCRGAVRPRPCL
jgi:hypothetical protein